MLKWVYHQLYFSTNGSLRESSKFVQRINGNSIVETLYESISKICLFIIPLRLYVSVLLTFGRYVCSNVHEEIFKVTYLLRSTFTLSYPWSIQKWKDRQRQKKGRYCTIQIRWTGKIKQITIISPRYHLLLNLLWIERVAKLTPVLDFIVDKITFAVCPICPIYFMHNESRVKIQHKINVVALIVSVVSANNWVYFLFLV